MAPFNPQVQPTRDPNYLGYSRPISGVEPDKTKALAIQGEGIAKAANIQGDAADIQKTSLALQSTATSLTEGVKYADAAIKESIDQQVYSGVDAERGAMIDSLRKRATNLATNPQANSNSAYNTSATPAAMSAYAQTTDPDSLVDAEGNIPEEVSGVGDAAARLDAARAHGKISATQYYENLDKVASGIRARYPGYREYIDRQIAQVTGVDPANAMVRSLIGDINSFMTAQNSGKNKIEAYLFKHSGQPDFPNMYKLWKDNKISDDEVLKWGHKMDSQTNFWKMRELELKNKELVIKSDKDDASRDAQQLVAEKVSNYFENIQLSAGLNTPKKISEWLVKVNTGEIPMPDSRQTAELAQLMHQYRTTIFNDTFQTMTRLGYTAKLGPEAVKEMINGNLVVHDNIATAIEGGNFSVASFSKRVADGLLNDARFNLLKDKDMGVWFANLNAIREFAGPQYVEALVRDLMTNTKFQEMQGKYQMFVSQYALRFQAQPDLRRTGNLDTLKGAIDDAESKGIKLPNVYSGLVSVIEGAADPKMPDEAKRRTLHALFDPKNEGLISKFNAEGSIDPVTGKPTRTGQYSVFARLTKPDILAEAYRLGKDDPALWRNAKNWVEKTFGRELFATAVKDLTENSTIMQNTDITWDPKASQWIPLWKTPDPKMAQYGVTSKVPELMARDIISRLNTGLRSVKQVAELEGKDVNDYVLGLMKGMGLDTEKYTGTIPAKMLKETLGKHEEYIKQQEELRRKYESPKKP